MPKPIKLQRHKHAVNVASELPFIDNPYDMLKSKHLKAKIKQCIVNLEKSFVEDDAKLFTAYCIATYTFASKHPPIRSDKRPVYTNAN